MGTGSFHKELVKLRAENKQLRRERSSNTARITKEAKMVNVTDLKELAMANGFSSVSEAITAARKWRAEIVELKEELGARQQVGSLLNKYTDVRPVAVMGAPDAHHVFLTLASKRFCVTPYGCETKRDAELVRETLIATLGTIVKEVVAAAGLADVPGAKPGPAGEIQTIDVDPSQEGWRRHPTLPRTWLLPNGCFYRFAPGMKETLIIPRSADFGR